MVNYQNRKNAKLGGRTSPKQIKKFEVITENIYIFNKFTLYRPLKQLFAKRKWSEDNYDDRLAFAKIMKEIETKVDSMEINTDKNLGVPENLSWRYEKSMKFVSNFKKTMDDGFKNIKGKMVFIKSMLSNYK